MSGKVELGALKAEIKAYARRVGFDLVGIAPCEAPQEGYERYLSWLKSGYHAEMAYMARPENVRRRGDPRLILPECQAIITLAVRYYKQSADNAQAGKPRGKVASYAWGNDYHDVLVRWLREIVKFIESKVGHPIPNRYYTDTGPILEKEFAVRGGLGWVGKNGLLINPQLGSYLFLAEILVGLPLEADEPFSADLCGSCTRCIDACPTHAILPNRTVDANLCISYLTIEHRGAIPPDLREEIGDWVFGCDICQSVCPWNRRPPEEGNLAFAPRAGVPRPILAEELRLTPQEFNRKFKGSAVKRTKRRGYLRNVAVALGNSGDTSEESISALTAALRDHEPLVRSHAAWALGYLGTEKARRALQTALASEEDAGVREEILQALGRCKKARE